jgi:hypothetical protein
MLKETRERWRAVVLLKVRGENGRVPEDAEIAERAGFRVRTLDHCYARPEFREMLRAEEERVREEIRLAAAARLLHALRNPADKDDGAKLALTVWDKSRRDGEENGCEGNGGNGLEARLERLSDRDLAAIAAFAADSAEAEPGGAADAGEDDG